jgi:putative endonuclease
MTLLVVRGSTELVPFLALQKNTACTLLVWYEVHESRESAFTREQQIKKWNRAWKLELIERFNPGWRDLAEELTA